MRSSPATAAGSDDPLAAMENSIALLILDNSEFGVGFVIASTPTTSYLLTAAHVLGCGDTQASGCRDTVKVRFTGQLSSLTGRRVLAWKDQTDGDRDLALVAVDKGNLTPIPILSQTRLGADSYVIGFTQHIILSSDDIGTPYVHEGSLSRIQSSDAQKHLNVWVPADPGFSGGPIVDKATLTVVGVFTGHLHATDTADIDYYGDGPDLVLQFLTAAKATTAFDFQELSEDDLAAQPATATADAALKALPVATARTDLARPSPVSAQAPSAASPTPPSARAVTPPSPSSAHPPPTTAAPLFTSVPSAPPSAQYALAQAYLTGNGVQANSATALQLLNQAADAHYPPALTALGIFYADGRYVDRDSARALALLQSAAAAGEPLAQLNLGNTYHFGKLDTTPNEAVSKSWYDKAYAALQAAGQQGDADAAWRLGSLFINGTGLDKPDVSQGLALLQHASDLGSAKASENLGTIYLNGRLVPKDVSRGLDYVHKAEQQGGPEATAYLAHIYLNGLFDQPRDAAAGTRYLQEAAERGNPWAAWRLGEAYRSGDLLPKDAAAAGQWFHTSSELGSLRGENDYGLWLLADAGSAPDNVSAGLAVLHDAAEKKHFARSMRFLGEFYRDGRYVPKNPTTAFNYFQSAAHAGGGPVIYYDLARAYEIGEGTAASLDQAKYWYARSANLKYAPAIRRMTALASSGKGLKDTAQSGDENSGKQDTTQGPPR